MMIVGTLLTLLQASTKLINSIEGRFSVTERTAPLRGVVTRGATWVIDQIAQRFPAYFAQAKSLAQRAAIACAKWYAKQVGKAIFAVVKLACTNLTIRKVIATECLLFVGTTTQAWYQDACTAIAGVLSSFQTKPPDKPG